SSDLEKNLTMSLQTDQHSSKNCTPITNPIGIWLPLQLLQPDFSTYRRSGLRSRHPLRLLSKIISENIRKMTNFPLTLWAQFRSTSGKYSYKLLRLRD